MVETVEMDTGEQAIVIEENYAKITEANQLQRNKYMIGSSTEWHQILIVHKRKCSKKDIIPALHQLVEDEFFFPIAYRYGRDVDKFFVHCQEKAILKFFDNDLTVNVKGNPLKIEMKLGVSLFRSGHLKPLDKLKEVVRETFKLRTLHGSDDVLNFDSFSNHDALKEIIVDLSNQSCLTLLINVISQKKEIKSEIKTLKLARNNIKNLKAFDNFHNMNFKVLDLTYNKISDIDDFRYLKTNQISEILLDGNPICEDYCDSPSDYVHYIRKFFIHLTVLDYCKLDPLHNLVTMKNYLEAPHGHAVVENFVQQFFTTYDSFERGKLKNFYLDKSIFTMSTYYEATEEDQGIIGRVRKYVDFSRNILKRHGLDNIVIGYNRIEEFFNALPPTAHDLTSFTIDVPLFQQKCIVITVSGVFKEVGNSLVTTDLIMGFSRTFVLTLRDKQQGLFNNAFKYCISNEQLSITNVDSGRKMNSFKHKPATEEDFKKHCKDLLPSEFEERETKLRLFKGLTGLNAANCEKYMTEQNWELDTALLTFITLMKGQSITANDFDHR
ncbi:unnamed protein product [Diamesa tonsa]